MKSLFKMILTITLASLMIAPAIAQVSTGIPTYGSFMDTPAGTLNLGNLNLNLAISILQKAGRGLPFQYSLLYDSSVWYPATVNGVQTWQPVANYGWSTGSSPALGYVTNTGHTVSIKSTCSFEIVTTYSNYQYIDVFGAQHSFAAATATSVDNPCTGTTWAHSGVPAQAIDGSGFTLTFGSAATPIITDRSGKIVTLGGASSKTDSNGNTISINSGVFTDTLGTTALTVANGANGTPTTFTYTAPAGPASAELTYKQYTVQTAFACPSPGVGEYSSTAYLVDRANLADGSYYQFHYEATPGVSGSVTGRLSSVSMPTGGTVNIVYFGGTSSTGIFCSDGSTSGMQITTPDGTTMFSRTASGSTWTTTVTDAQQNQSVITLQEVANNFYETNRLVYQGSSSGGTLKKTVDRCYFGATPSTCTEGAFTLPISEIQTTTSLPSASGMRSMVDIVYNSYGLETSHSNYDYGNGAVGALLRKTITSYASLGNLIVNKPAQITVQDGSGNTVSQTAYSYDQTAAVATSGTPQHATISGSRGNLTTLTKYVSASKTLSSAYIYYDTGLAQTVQDVNGATTSYTYGGCGNSFITQEAGPTGLTEQFTWNCNGSVLTSITDANSQTTSSAYTDPYFWRPSSSTDAAGNVTYYTYNSASSGKLASYERDMGFNSGGSAVDVITTLDPLGRALTRQVRQSPGSSTFDSVSYAYDALGRRDFKSLPYGGSQGQANNSGPGKTTTYDAISRKVATSDSGGGIRSIGYTGSDVLVTLSPAPVNENAKRKQYEYDGLGRLTSVCELTATLTGNGTCGQTIAQTGYWTKYSYSGLSKILGVVQNAQAISRLQQTRTYAYDWLGRLTSETNPENNTTAYTYDTDSTCGNSNGDLVKKIDAVGNVTCISYDSLHRPTQETYSGPYAANTPTKHLVYDSATVNGATMANAKGRLAEAYTGASASKITDLGFSYTARGEISGVLEQTPHSGGYFSINTTLWANGSTKTLSGIPSVPIITVGVDGEGRPSTMNAGTGQNLALSTIYNAASQVTNLEYGSLDSDTFGFDPNTGRKTSYQFSVDGQSVAGNLSWNPNGSLGSLAISDPFNTANSQSCSYTHDDLGRIATTNCTGSSPWSQTFTFDTFGNINKSGTQSFVAGYSPTTNWISTGIPGVGYDTNGNLISIASDYTHHYSWDADGNQISTDGITTTFDALDRAVERLNSGIYTQIIYGPTGGKLALVQGGTSGSLVKSYVPLPGGATAVYTSNGLAFYRHPDWLGSSRFASTPTAPTTVYYDGAYAPYGESYAETGTTDRSFTGQNQDTEPGQFDFLTRNYSAVQGRWLSPDRAGLQAVRLKNPQSWNRYAYVTNHPLRSVDSLGMDDAAPCDQDGVDPSTDDPDCANSGGGGDPSSPVQCSPDDPSCGTTPPCSDDDPDCDTPQCADDDPNCNNTGNNNNNDNNSCDQSGDGTGDGTDNGGTNGDDPNGDYVVRLLRMNGIHYYGSMYIHRHTAAQNSSSKSCAPNNGTPQPAPQPQGNSWSHPFNPPTCHQWTLWAGSDTAIAAFTSGGGKWWNPVSGTFAITAGIEGFMMTQTCP